MECPNFELVAFHDDAPACYPYSLVSDQPEMWLEGVMAFRARQIHLVSIYSL